ncbi:MAG: hypothetical protein ACLRQF_08625 [Thomasclavelia ramosa]
MSDGVDTSKAGSYEVIYRITDALGNEVEFRMVEVMTSNQMLNQPIR